jgi:hypothetical protein
MTVINIIGKKQLAERKLNFISCPSLAIPVLEKTYYAKFSWFTTLDALILEMNKRKPLIVLDSSDKAVTHDKIPLEMRNLPEVFCIRAWESLPERDWSVVRNNICETDNHHFTFKWDIDNCSDPIILAAVKKKERADQVASDYAKKELEEFMASAKAHNKRHPLLST